MCTIALKETPMMYLVKNTFIDDVDDGSVHDEWETKSCPGRLEESDHMEDFDDCECVDTPHPCTTVTKHSCDTAVPCCTIIAKQFASSVPMDMSLWPLRWLCNCESG